MKNESISLTLDEAKELYYHGLNCDRPKHTPDEWQFIREDMEKVINASSCERAEWLVNHYILNDETYIKFVSRIRRRYREMKGKQ